MTLSETFAYLFSPQDAFDDPLVRGIALGAVAVLAVVGAIIFAMRAMGRTNDEAHAELRTRWISWLWLVALIGVPVLLGRGPTILAALVLGLLAYREFARATGVFRERALSIVVTLAALAVCYAALDRWHRLHLALPPLTVAAIAIVGIPFDRPKGYLQRTALAALGFLLFVHALGYIGLLTDTPRWRALILTLVAAVELNDVFAFVVGKTFGGAKLIPNTSPGKTRAGALGAMALTTALVTLLTRVLFEGTALNEWPWPIVLGVSASVLGQMGDLVLSSVKRDIGLKDYGAAISGHGGILDRFDSLVLIPPACYHLLSLVNGPPIGTGEPSGLFQAIVAALTGRAGN